MQLLRRLTHVLILVMTLVVGAASAAVIVSQTAWFKNLIRAYIVREASHYLNGTVSIERLGGNLLFGLELENVDVSMDGQQVVTIKDMGLDYNVWDFLTQNLSLDNIRLNKPVIHLRRVGDTWTLSRLVKKQEGEAGRRGPGRTIAIGDIGISDGAFIIDDPVGTSGVEVPKRIDRVDAKLAFNYEPVHYSIEISHLSFRGSEPSLALNALSGSVAVRDDAVYFEDLAIRTAETSLSVEGAVREYQTRPVFNLRVSSDKLSITEVARLFPVLTGIRLQPQVDVAIAGPADRLGVEMDVVSTAGRVHASMTADVEAPSRSMTGNVSVRHLDLGAVLNDPARRSDITGDARGTARFENNRIDVDVAGTGYGATASAKGHIVLPARREERVAYDLRGRTRNVDLRRLPALIDLPRASTSVNADYHVHTAAHSVGLELRFDPSTIAGTRIAKGGTAAFALGETPVAYKADLNVSGLDLQRVGTEFGMPALAAERYKTAINGRIVSSGRVGEPNQMDVVAEGTITNSELLGGHVDGTTFVASVAHDTAWVKAVGEFSDVDPAMLTRKSSWGGRIAGALNIDATIGGLSRGVTPDGVEARGTVTLQPSTIGELAITKATIDGSYRKSTAEIQSLDVAGPDLNLQARGTMALDEQGASNLIVHADTPSLEKLGSLVDQPLAGRATVDATVTGNKRQLEATGRYFGNDVEYRGAQALSLEGDFTAQVPNLSVPGATVAADTRATFVAVGGQEINEVAGRVSVHREQLEFDLTARQPQRSLGASGSMLVNAGRQEVHLQKLALEAAGQTWQLAAGSSPTIVYAHGDVRIDSLALANGDQGLTVAGAYGQSADALTVTAANVDVASLNALLLRAPQFSGRLDGTATVRAGASDRRLPQVDADFRVRDGAFRQFRYTAFGGTVRYQDRGMLVDTKLEQSPTTYLTVKGYVPTAAFTTASSAEREAAHGAAVDPADRVDVHVESTPIDLGLVQGFTSELTNVTGTVQANVDVTGPASDPHPSGLITLQKGAFTVNATGVAYTDVEGKIELQPDRVRVAAISALDNHLNPITISGDLAVHEREVGAVKIYVHTDDFKVIDNELGNVRVNTDLEITGELRAPRVEGSVGMTTGMLNLDRLLEQTGESAYATAPAEFAPAATVAPAQQPARFDATKALAALSMNVHVTVPNDLIVKAADLRAAAAPVGLGALTMTLGADLRATKKAGDDLVLVGVVNTVRGNYVFQGRRFEIQREGFVRFTGESVGEMDPTLEIAATRLIRAVETRVNVRGTVRKPEFVLSSVPPLGDADILSLILFNQPVNELGEAQQVDLVQQAQYLAGSTLTRGLSKSVASALNLDEFEINLTPESGAGPQVRFGQQIGQNLFFRLEQGIGDKSQTNFVVEYELLEWLRLQTNVLQGSGSQQQVFQRAQGSGVDLLFFFSY